MPTGYTADIQEGISFEDFVMRCARAFGALISMREDSPDAEIKEFKPNSYNQDNIHELKKEQARVCEMSEEETSVEAKKEYQANIEKRKNAKKKDLEIQQKYNEMLEKVRRWDPPTKDHVNLKEFMIDQIEKSLEFDCYINNFDEYHPIPILQTGEEWKSKELLRINKSLLYHYKELKKEENRCNERNRWVKQLRDSLRTSSNETSTE